MEIESRIKEGRLGGRLSVQALVEAAVMVALATVLSLVVVFRAPQGGEVTAAGMVPIMVLAIRRGPRVGLMAGAVFGMLQLWIAPYVFHWAQVILDYPVAFGLLGLAGAFPHRPYLGVTAGILGRGVSHILSGVVFFGAYAPEGINVWAYSAVYNGTFLIPELALSLLVVLALSAGFRGEVLRRV
jgi:thiamine transporter